MSQSPRNLSRVTCGRPDCWWWKTDSHGLFTIDCMCSFAKLLPIIVLTGTDDPELASRALAAGAQDYLVKHETHQAAIPSAIRRAIERFDSIYEPD